MEFRDLLLNDNITYYRVIEEDLELFQLLFDNEFDNFLPALTKWEEISLQKTEQKVDCDFCQIEEFDCILVNEKTKKFLSSFLSFCDIEFLPCKTENGYYYILHITNLIKDSIIEEDSEFEKTEQGSIINVTNLVLEYELVENKPLFKIKELPYIVFMSDDFEEFCMQQGLTGIDFSENNEHIAADYI